MKDEHRWEGHFHHKPQHPVDHGAKSKTPERLKLLSYNIQVGIPGESLRKFVTGGWRHVLPHAARLHNLTGIAKLVREFDIVALQEIDAGSIRSNYINQVEYLAHTAGFPYWYWQLNRSFGRFAQQCNGALSRYFPYKVDSHKLPGLIPGRGAMFMQFGDPKKPLMVVAMHLSLTRRSRNLQLEYIAEKISDYEYVILMGDMNTPCYHLVTDSPLKDTSLHPVNEGIDTFPSWRPSRNIDHFFVSPNLEVEQVEVYDHTFSDHLPIGLSVALPKDLQL